MKKYRKVLAAITVILAAICAGGEVFFRAFIDRRGLKRVKIKKINGGDAASKEQIGPKIETGKEWFLAQNLDKIEMTSFDGLRLVGWYLPCKDAVRTVMCVHGYRGSGIKDFGYVAQFYHERKSNVFVIDHRAHGESEGKHICYGNKERQDCVDWLHLLNEKYGDHLPMYLDGVSMGGATVLMTSNMDLPENMAGIIADCGFTSHWDIAAYVMKNEYHVPQFPFLHLAAVWCRIKAGYWPQKVSTLDCVKEAKVPILFLHGKKDQFVPYEMGLANYEACTSYKMMVTIEEAGHALCYMMDEETCQKELLSFFQHCEK